MPCGGFCRIVAGVTASALPVTSGALGPPRSLRAKCESLLKQMELVRAPKIARWQDCEDYIAPYSSNVRRGQPRTGVSVDILDETPFYCRKTLQSFLASTMTNPAQVWSEWTLPNEVKEFATAKEWLHTLNERRFTLLGQSNFYEVMNWVYGEWPVFATAVVLIEEDEEDVFRYVPWEIGSYALADDAKGNPIALSRRFTMTVRQVVDRFARTPNGDINRAVLSRHVLQQVEAGNWESDIEVAHLICPNEEHRPNARTGRFLPFASYYWEFGRNDVDSPAFLAKEGYHEWPAMVFRWGRMGGDPWGTDSPGYLTLGAIKSAQTVESDALLQVELLGKPPVVVPTALTNTSLLPAAQNKVDMRAGMQAGPLHTVNPAGVVATRETQDRISERIFAIWYTRLILSTNARDTMRRGSSQPRTAREIEEISAERFQILGPVVEAAGPALRVGSDREFAIMQRRGLLPPAPPEIEGMPLTIEYTSALGIARKSVGLSAVVQYGLQQAELYRLTGQQEILDRTNWSELAQAQGDRSGLPPKVQRTDEEVAAIQRARAEAQVAQAQAEQMALEAKATKDLSQAPLGEDTALDAVVQGQQAGALP